MNKILSQSLIKYGIAALFGAIGGAVTVLIVVLLDEGLHEIWTNIFGISTETPTQTSGVFIAMAIATILISFIMFRYGKAATTLESIIEDIQEHGKVNWRALPKALLIAFPSLFTGASLGPEAPSAIASVAVTGFVAEKTGMKADNIKHANFAAFSGMLGSILSSPFLAPSMILETSKNSLENIKPYLTTSLIASAFGTATFFIIFGKIYTFSIPSSTYEGSGYKELLVAFVLGIVGCVFVAAVSKIIDVANKIIDKIAKTDIIRLYITAVIVSILMYLVPVTMFSGQHTLDDLYTISLTSSFIGLIVIGVVKVLSTSLLIRAGFVGGAIFPAIFAGSAFGLAMNQIFNVSPIVAVGATTVGLLALMMRQPLSAALLTLLIFGFTSGAAIVCGLAGALLVLSILPKK